MPIVIFDALVHHECMPKEQTVNERVENLVFINLKS